MTEKTSDEKIGTNYEILIKFSSDLWDEMSDERSDENDRTITDDRTEFSSL